MQKSKPEHILNAPCGKNVPIRLSRCDQPALHSIPGPLSQFLRPYQIAGVQFLYHRYLEDGGGILADDMGLGKTIQVIALLAALLEKSNFEEEDTASCRRVRFGSGAKKQFLVIAPSSVLYNWEQEFEYWGYYAVKRFHRCERGETLRLARERKVEVVLTTFETAREAIDELNSLRLDAVIVDEVHKLKDPKAQITGALKQLRCRRRFGLTGTALQNKYDELWCILDWANPGCLGSLPKFNHEFASRIEKGLRFDALKGELVEARKLQKELDDLKKRWMLRRTKDKTLAGQLPTKSDFVVFCRPTKFQSSVFASLLSSEEMRFVLSATDPCACGSRRPRCRCCFKTLDGKSFKAVLFTFLHLFIKTANHVGLLLPSNTRSEQQAIESERICEIAFREHEDFVRLGRKQSFLTLSDPKYSGKMQVLVGLLENLEEENAKVLLFSYSTMVLNILESFMQSKGYEYRRFDGTTKPELRIDIVNEFNRDPNIFVLLISTRAGGLGLNITGANIVIVYDPNWNPSHDLQAQDRAYRIGQTRNVKVFRLVTSGSIEENIYLRQVYKQQLGRNAVDGENAKRYFHAVQGNNMHKGELFGIRNLFSVRDGGCLTSEILKRDKKVEAIVRGKKNLRIEENLFKPDENTGDGQSKSDPYNVDLDMDEMLESEFTSIKSRSEGNIISNYQKKKTVLGMGKIFKSVAHCHDNQTLIGGSRVEDHISARAMEGVGGSQEPALLNLPVLEPTQHGVDDTNEGSEDDEEEVVKRVEESSEDEEEPPPSARANSDRIFRTQVGGCLFYGQTPSAIQRKDFAEMAEYLGQTTAELASNVLQMDEADRAKLLSEFYSSKGIEGAKALYDKVISEIDDKDEVFDADYEDVFKELDEEIDTEISKTPTKKVMSRKDTKSTPKNSRFKKLNTASPNTASPKKKQKLFQTPTKEVSIQTEDVSPRTTEDVSLRTADKVSRTSTAGVTVRTVGTSLRTSEKAVPMTTENDVPEKVDVEHIVKKTKPAPEGVYYSKRRDHSCTKEPLKRKASLSLESEDFYDQLFKTRKSIAKPLKEKPSKPKDDEIYGDDFYEDIFSPRKSTSVERSQPKKSDGDDLLDLWAKAGMVKILKND